LTLGAHHARPPPADATGRTPPNCATYEATDTIGEAVRKRL
jgi:hypothetical protein